MTVRETLDRVAERRLVLPAIQREFVWVTDQERMTRLFDSLLRRYPIGTFLFWNVPARQSKDFDFYEVMRVWHERDRRHNPRHEPPSTQDLTAILDGQQRITTLNIGLRGSLAQRAKYKRSSSSDAFPVKRLYLDLLFTPGEEDDVEYRFAFLTSDQAAESPESHWYRVGDILDIAEGLPLFRYVQQHGLADRERPIEVLSRLWAAVHQDGVISAFEEKGERLDRVLDIFVRVNSGGVVLSKSDLLLSMATAQFRTRDAREEVHSLVDELNREGAGFNFSKDLVLKAGLVLTGISDIGFRVDNFTTTNMNQLEQNWDRLTSALRVGARLLSSFGLSSETLPANSVLIPLADYVYSRGLTQTLIDSQSADSRADRQTMRQWTLRTILMPGIWGSGLDQLLRGLHRAISESVGAFPREGLEREMARRGKSMIFNDTLVDDLLNTPYKHARTFALLSLMYETVDTLSAFHIDHVFPRALATRAKLLAQGIPPEQVDDVRDKLERLPNLQLLHGPANIDKRAQMPDAWITGRFPAVQARHAWLAENDLLGLPTSFTRFNDFYDARQALMRRRLSRLLDADAGMQATDLERAIEVHGLSEQPEPRRVRELRPMPLRQKPGRPKARFQEQISDLVADGRLAAGQVIHFNYYGRRHEAAIERFGIRVGNKVFASPSAAAMDLTNGTSVNGWLVWRLADGTSIGDLRQQ